MSETYVYAKAEYNMLGTSGDAPSWEHASGSILFFLRWAMDNNLMSKWFDEESEEGLAEYRKGALSLFEFFEKECDLVLLSDMLSDEGNGFARAYFDYEAGRYLDDVWATLGLQRGEYPLYTEESYGRLKSLFDSRHASWKAGDLDAVRRPERPKKWWQFWK
jgi:hypothetical protein